MRRTYVALAGSAALLWVLVAQAAPTTDEKIEILSEELERLKTQIAADKGVPAGQERGKATIGGYGELHYNNLDSKKEIDLHRFVLFFATSSATRSASIRGGDRAHLPQGQHLRKRSQGRSGNRAGLPRGLISARNTAPKPVCS